METIQVKFSHAEIINIQSCQSMSEKSVIWYQRHEYNALRQRSLSDIRMIQEAYQNNPVTASVDPTSCTSNTILTLEKLTKEFQLFDTKDKYSTVTPDSDDFCARGLELCVFRQRRKHARIHIWAVLKVQEKLKKRKLGLVDASCDTYDKYDPVQLLQTVSRKFSRSARRNAAQIGKEDELAANKIHSSDDNEYNVVTPPVTPPSSPIEDDRNQFSSHKKARVFGKEFIPMFHVDS